MEDAVQEPFREEWPREFTYLGRGNQAFAFESGRYVIKFFDRRKMEVPWYGRFASANWVQRRVGRALVQPVGYRLAYEHLREETALLQVHLGKSAQRYPIVTVRDRASRPFQIDLNEVPFILQEKAENSFLEALESSADVRPLLDQYLAIQRKRIGLGIANHDRHIKDNYRCQGERLIYIDPGRFYMEPALTDPERLQAEWEKATYEVRRWVETRPAIMLDAYCTPRLEDGTSYLDTSTSSISGKLSGLKE